MKKNTNELFSPTISVVVPCYNEEKIITNTLASIMAMLNKYKEEKLISKFEIIPVDDGSKDMTFIKLETFSNENKSTVFPIINTDNKGKGSAVKDGFKRATGDYIFFMDADLATSLSYIKIFLLSAGTYDIVIANRTQFKEQNEKDKTFLRKILSFGSAICTKMLLPELSDIEDTQCGFKMFKKDIAKTCCENATLDNYAFDLEFLLISKKTGCKILEMPVIWKNGEESKISPLKDSIAFFKSILALKKISNSRKVVL